MSDIQADAARYAKTVKSTMSTSLDYYVWREMRKYYDANGVPPKGSAKCAEIEKMKADLYVEYMKMWGCERKDLDAEFRSRSVKN